MNYSFAQWVAILTITSGAYLPVCMWLRPPWFAAFSMAIFAFMAVTAWWKTVGEGDE